MISPLVPKIGEITRRIKKAAELKRNLMQIGGK